MAHHRQYEEQYVPRDNDRYDDDRHDDRDTSRSRHSNSDKGVSRKKYEHLKYKTREWYEQAQEYKGKIDKLVDTNEELERTNEKLYAQNKELAEKLNKTMADADRWKKCSENLPDADFTDELENENKTLRKDVRALKKKCREWQDKYESKVAALERDLMLKDGKLQALEETKKDLKERYKDLKEDLRDYQRWSRGSRAPNHE